MEEEFNYEAVPYGYAHCFSAHCPKGGECLHHLAAMHSTDRYPTLSVVNPNCIPEDADSCPSFRPIRKIRVAWGIRHLLDHVTYKDADSLKRMMISHFGRGMYYRFYRKERFVTPEQQEYIQRIFRQKGITDQLAFDSYTEEYKWE